MNNSELLQGLKPRPPEKWCNEFLTQETTIARKFFLVSEKCEPNRGQNQRLSAPPIRLSR